MKKVLFGFFGGLFIALIIYIIWAVYSINTFQSSLGQAEHPFLNAKRNAVSAIASIEAGGEKMYPCGGLRLSLTHLRSWAKTKEDKDYVIEAESKYASLCS